MRSVIINSYGIRSLHDDAYARGQIVFKSFGDALAAIRGFRAGDSDWASLGDWSAIIGEFDRFRDGRAAARLREHIEAVACGCSRCTAGGPRDWPFLSVSD